MQFTNVGRRERFPQLKIVSAENDVAWGALLHVANGFSQDRFGRSGAPPVKLSLKPSEYVKRQENLFVYRDLEKANKLPLRQAQHCSPMILCLI